MEFVILNSLTPPPAEGVTNASTTAKGTPSRENFKRKRSRGGPTLLQSTNVNSGSSNPTDAADTAAEPKYECNVCRKRFYCFQALGGHKSSHRKKTPIRNPAGNPRACRICPLVFPSGQALGGHQRAHYVSPAEAQIASGGGGHVSSENDTCPTTYATVTASSMTSSDGDGASTRTPARRPMFDLNEPPEMDSRLGPGADPEDQMRGDEHEVENPLPAKKNPPGSSSLAI